MLEFLMKYFIEILFTLLTSIIIHLYRKIHKYINTMETLEKVACINLKKYIQNQYEIIKEKNFVTIEEKEELINVCEYYKRIECSKIIETLIKEIDNIPIK